MTDTMELFADAEGADGAAAGEANTKRSGKNVPSKSKNTAGGVLRSEGTKVEKPAKLPSASKLPTSTKAEQVLKKLGLAKGATIEMLIEITGWQAHSVRGFLSGTVKKKLGHSLTSEVGKDGLRRYRIDGSAAAAK